jgi:hypothetical protein
MVQCCSTTKRWCRENFPFLLKDIGEEDATHVGKYAKVKKRKAIRN